jgi:GT2 family glycosyltransferase
VVPRSGSLANTTRDTDALKLLEQQHLVGVAAREAVGPVNRGYSVATGVIRTAMRRSWVDNDEQPGSDSDATPKWYQLSGEPVTRPASRLRRAPVALSVVVPSYRRTAALNCCLRALAAQSLRPLELIVVVRAEDPESLAVASGVPNVRVLTVDEPGQVAALNCGCDAAMGDIIAITDDDAQPRPNWLQAIAARFETDPRIGAVGGRDVVHSGGRILDGEAKRVGHLSWWGRRVGNHHLRASLQDVDFLKGANMAFRATAREPFDRLLHGGGAQVCNDLEATWSIRRRGWRVVYDPCVVVDHYPAPRHDDHARNVRSMPADRAAEHNELYALMRHAPTWQRVILLAYAILIGKRHAPGLVLAIRTRPPDGGGARLVGLTLARLSALRTLRCAWHVRRR